MAIANLSNGLASLVETIVKAGVVNSAYLTRGTSRIPVDQMKGKRAGDTYSFVIDNVTATYSSALDNNGKIAMGAMGAPTKVDLKVGYCGSKVSLGAISKALELGDWKQLSKEIGAGLVNEFALQTAVADMAGMAHEFVNNVKGIAKASAVMAASFQGKQYGFASPIVTGEIQGEGRNLQPISIDPAWGVGLEGKVFNISELRSMILPTIVGDSNVTIAHTANAGTATLTDATAGCCYKKGSLVVYATSATAGTVLLGKANATLSATAAETDNYAPVIIRVEGAQAWGDAGDCLDGADNKHSEEGISIAQSEVKQGGFAVDHEFAMAGAAGLANPSKAKVVWLKA